MTSHQLPSQCHQATHKAVSSQREISASIMFTFPLSLPASSSFVAANNRFSPLGDSVKFDRLSGPLAGYATPPQKHSEGDNCPCVAAGQRQQQQQDCNGATAANKWSQPPKDGDDTEEDDAGPDTEYMELSSPRAIEAQGEVGYLKMRSYPIGNNQRPPPVEYVTVQHRRSDIGEILIPQRAADTPEGSGFGSSRMGSSTDRMTAGLPSSGGGTQACVDSSVLPTTTQRQSLPPSPHRPPLNGHFMDSPVSTAAGGTLPQPLLHLPHSPHSAKAKNIPAVPPRTVVSPNRSSSVENQLKGQLPVPLPRKGTSISSAEPQNLPSPGPTLKTNYVINIGHRDMPLVDVLQLEFPDVDPFTCKRFLEAHNYNMCEAKEHLKMEQLMSMGIPNTTIQDCKRALEHCQHSVDRAASWLLDNKQLE